MSASVLFLGWDRADWRVLEPMLAEGRLPRLRRLIDSSERGTLLSAFPPHSVAAWTSFLSGQPSAVHGVLDFRRGDKRRYFPIVPHTSSSVPSPDLLQYLSLNGRRVLSANIPMTFPPRQVDGLVVGGVFLPPGAVFTHPPTLQAELDSLGGFPINGLAWNRSRSLFELIDEALHVTRRHTAVFGSLLERHRWDVALFGYMAPDR